MFRMTLSHLFSAALFSILVFSTPYAQAGIALGATRVIYPADQKQVSLGITNNDNNTFLIQSWVENDKDEKTQNVVVTPPLFVMKGKKENALRIIDGSNGRLPKDRETLMWLNVKAIPSLDKEQADKNMLQFAVVSRIKLFHRPAGLTMPPEKAYSALTFSRSGNTLTITNPTPYYITATNVKSNNKELKNFMVAPMANITLPVPPGANNVFSYQAINDFGALTAPIQVNAN